MLRKYKVSIERIATLTDVTAAKMVVVAENIGMAESLVMDALDDNEASLLWCMTTGKDKVERRIFKIMKTQEIDKLEDRGH